MNGSKNPLYISLALMLGGFLLVLNAYWELKADVEVNQEKVTQLQEQIDSQAKPCQAEDLLYPDLSDGCTIPANPTNQGTTQSPSTRNQSQSSPQTPPSTSQPNQVVNPPPDNTPPPEPPEEPPEEPSPVCMLLPILCNGSRIFL